MGDGSFHDDERRGTRAGRGSQGCLLCPSGCHRFANFQSYRFIVAALSDLQLIAANPPSGPALPGLGGVYSFLPNLSPEALAEDRADHVFLMVDMGCAHAGTVNRARGLRRFSKREVRA